MLFKKEKIEMTLAKYNYAPGEMITGNINLDMKKPAKARGLSVRFLGEVITTRTVRDSNGRMRTETKRTKVWDQKIPIDGEKEYQDAQYNFEIKIPADILDQERSLDGALGGAVKALRFMSGTRERLEWHVIAKLDIPKALDVSKKQQITLT